MGEGPRWQEVPKPKGNRRADIMHRVGRRPVRHRTGRCIANPPTVTLVTSVLDAPPAQVIKDTVKKENVPDAQVRQQARFARKLAKFEQPAAPAAAKTEALYNKSVKDKLASFEAAKKV